MVLVRFSIRFNAKAASGEQLDLEERAKVNGKRVATFLSGFFPKGADSPLLNESSDDMPNCPIKKKKPSTGDALKHR